MFTFRGRRRFAFGQLVSSQEGSAAVEFAVLCGVVVCSLAVGIYFLGQISKAAMSSAAVAIGSGHAGDPLTSLVSATDTHASEDAAKSQATDVAQTGSHWQMAAIVAAMLVACGAPLSFILLRSRRQLREPSRKPAADESPQPPEHDELAFAKRQQIRRVFQNNMASLLDGHLKVRHVMSRQLTCVPKAAPLKTVLEMMEVKRVDHVLVSDTDHVLLGIISNRDCEQRKGKRAADIMTAEPVAVDADSDLSPAVTMLVRKRITCLPVTSDGKLIGILTTTDFLMALQCALHTLSNVADQFTSSSGDSPLAGKAKEMRLNSDAPSQSHDTSQVAG